MSEKRKKLEPGLSGESYFANFIHNLEALLQAEPLFSYIRSATLSLLAMSLATPSIPAKYCSSLRSNVHAKAQRESQVLAGRASVSQKGIFYHFKTVSDKLPSEISACCCP